MKFSGVYRKHIAVWVPFAIMLFLCIAGVAFGSSGAEHGEAAAAHQGWAATDWQRVLNFGILLAALIYFVRKPASEALNGRIDGIKKELSSLEARKKEAEEKLADYNKRIAALDKEAEDIIAQYRKQGEAARERILRESEKTAAKLEEQAKRNIEQEFKNAKLQLQEDILKKALEKAEALVKEKITTDDQDRLVDEYLDKVVVQ